MKRSAKTISETFMTNITIPSLVAEQKGRVLQVTIKNPSSRNALTREIFDGGIQIFSRLRNDRSVGAIVLSGYGDHFCGGGSLQRMQAQRQKPPYTQAEHVDAAHAWILAMREAPQPIIAAVEGAAAGGGFALALACDLVVAADDAKMVMSHVNIGLSPDCGGTYWLARRLPHQLALEIMLSGRPVPVERLLECGLVNQIVSSRTAVDAAMKWAGRLANGPFDAQASIKRLAQLAESNILRTQLIAERDSVVEAVYGHENAEGIAAFLERRTPNFTAIGDSNSA